MRGATRAREREQAIIAAGWTRSSPTRYSSDEMQSGSKNCSGGPQSAFCHCVGRVAEWFKAAVLKTARGFTLPRGFESHPFRQEPSDHCLPMFSSSPAYAHNNGFSPLLYCTCPPKSAIVGMRNMGRSMGCGQGNSPALVYGSEGEGAGLSR